MTDVDDVIHGTTTLDVRFVEAGSRLRLDLINRSEELEGKGMVVQGVESGGVALDFAHADNAVVIDLGREAEAGERVKVQVHYQGIPATGPDYRPK